MAWVEFSADFSQRPDCMADDAVRCESSSPTLSSPCLTGKLNREFCRIRPSIAIFGSNQRADSTASSRIPCAPEQGISKRVSGKIFQGTGNRHAAIRRRSALDRAPILPNLNADPAEHARRIGRCLLMGVKRTQGGRISNVCLLPTADNHMVVMRAIKRVSAL
jgi:hypothetical protein